MATDLFGVIKLAGHRSRDRPKTTDSITTLGFLIQGLWADQKSSMFGVWAVPAAGKPLPKGGALRAPPFGRGFQAAGAALPDPKHRRISGRPKNAALKILM